MAKEDQTKLDSIPVTEARKKGAFMKWMMIGIAGFIMIAGLLAGGIFGFQYFTRGHENQKNEKATASILWPLDPFIVNLADNTSERYLKAVMQLEVTGQEDVHALDELKPKFRDSVLDILSSKSYGEIIEISGKQRLREDIASKLNSFLSKGKIKQVYFTEFVIQ